MIFIMERKVENRKTSAKRNILIITVIVALLVGIVIVLLFAMQPPRTVANFCKIAKEEKSVLTGNVNYEKRLELYKKLEAVSPDNIRSDITTVRKGYEEIIKSPSNTLGTGLGISGAENRRTAYINSNCKDF